MTEGSRPDLAAIHTTFKALKVWLARLTLLTKWERQNKLFYPTGTCWYTKIIDGTPYRKAQNCRNSSRAKSSPLPALTFFSEQTKHFQSTEPLHPAQSHNPLLLHSEWDSTTVPHTRSLSPFCSLMSCLVLMMQTFVDAPFMTHRDLLTLRKSNILKTVDMTGRLRRPCRSVLYLSRREKRCRLLREREGTVTGSCAISVKWIWVFSSCLSAVKKDLNISEYAEEWRINLTHAFTNNFFFLHFL